MRIKTGRSLSPGSCTGVVRFLHGPDRSIPFSSVPRRPEEELIRFHRALDHAADQLASMGPRALEQAGQAGADILHIHAMLLEDPDILQEAESLIRGGLTAQQAAEETGRRFSNAFSAMDDEKLRTQAADVSEVAQQVADILSGEQGASLAGGGRVLLAAEDLAPGQLLELGRERLLGLILSNASPYGHTAILARAMGLPAITGVTLDTRCAGNSALADAHTGRLYLDPEGSLSQQESQLGRTWDEAELQLPAVTPDGRRLTLLANIGSAAEAATALELGAEGVGLFRTEFLFLGRPDCPGEEEQFAAYRQIAQTLGGRPAAIRTLDAGGDKPLSCLSLPPQPNPALGCRGIRLSLLRPELFRVQLWAILRAAAFGPLSILLPMVTTPEEVRQAKAILAQCREELEREGLPFGSAPVGVMIETPAAALTADALAEESAFFSLGTNDLIQYTLAADRQTTQGAAMWDPRHPAVVSLLHMAVEAAHRRNIQVTLCGEIGADPAMTASLLDLKVDALSVTPAVLPALRHHIRSLASQ